MRIALVLVAFILLLSPCSAYPLGILNETAPSLVRGDNISTVRATEQWVVDHISFKFYSNPLGIPKTLDWERGDCSDRNMLVRALLSRNGIDSRPVYGYCLYNTAGRKVVYKHDWTVVDVVSYGATERVISDTWYCEKYEQIGYGMWMFPWIGEQRLWNDEDFDKGYLSW